MLPYTLINAFEITWVCAFILQFLLFVSYDQYFFNLESRQGDKLKYDFVSFALVSGKVLICLYFFLGIVLIHFKYKP